MSDALPLDCNVQAPPGYVVALDHVVTRADANLPLEDEKDNLETLLSNLGQLAGVFRGDDVYSLLRQGESALLAGALGRSLVESAAAEHWYASRAETEEPRTATLALERENIAQSIIESGLCVPNVARWNNPLADTRYADAAAGPALPNLQSALSSKAPSTVERITALPAPVTDVLSMCSHVNYAATWLTVAPQPTELGVRPSRIFAAVLAQSSGLSLASLRGFNYEPVVLDLVATATAVHDLDVLPRLGREKLVQDMSPSRSASSTASWLEKEPPFLFEVLLEGLRDKAERVWHLANEAPNPFGGSGSETNLTTALPYLTARGLLMLTLRSTYGDCSPLMAPTGARMLLEQGSELSWRSADPSDEELLARYVAVMDDATDRKKALEQKLLTRTSSTWAVEDLLYPLGRSDFAVDTRRTPTNEIRSRPPSPKIHLSALALGVAEPNWGDLAYKLLTQAAHATPLGLLHSVARLDPKTGNPALSHEMTALSIDTACIGAALTFQSLAPLIALQAGLPSPREWLKELFEAVSEVHRDAQLIHFLG
ncbi:hypothetical protein SAMN04487916_12233 [Arthrobacter sp. ov407]|uniref:hypothetical protein n=1 Tax=Arthrobacter sp. ov407 TaxID=1761748 RepID=UPI00088930CD|nr:hypothetical protein [Arthrobacter sp. ov407]SDM03067.1 hypothetical protein SAMN04487916_12233 [Arthrobacter sp. ov407]